MLLALAFGIVAALWKAVLIVVAALVVAAPYLAVIAIVACLAVFLVLLKRLNDRLNERQRLRESERQNALNKQEEERQTANAIRIQQSVLAADLKTRDSIETIIASLRRFDHRLEVAITPAHYTDLFGDNWVNVREFSESSCGRKVPEVSAMLVDIIICYKQAQNIAWIPENVRVMQSWWSQASKKRKWLSDLVAAAQAPIVAAPSAVDVLEAVAFEEPKVASIPEMAVRPLPASPSKRPSSIHEMVVEPPPAPPVVQSPPPRTRRHVPLGPAPTLSVPPTLEELQRYSVWVSGNS